MEKVLIIDDNPTDRFIQQKMLESQYEVKVTASPIKGKEIIMDWRPDIIIVDYAMPEMNGIAAIKHYKEKMKYDGIYLILTGLDDINIATEAIRMGAYDYLVKPLVSEIFSNKIKNCMNYRKLQQHEDAKIVSAAIERIILSIYYDMKPIYEQIEVCAKNISADAGHQSKECITLLDLINKLGISINNLAEMDQPTKKEYIESILNHYMSS